VFIKHEKNTGEITVPAECCEAISDQVNEDVAHILFEATKGKRNGRHLTTLVSTCPDFKKNES
jgi:hypothetical protein